jgi:hypothetical protein
MQTGDTMYSPVSGLSSCTSTLVIVLGGRHTDLRIRTRELWSPICGLDINSTENVLPSSDKVPSFMLMILWLDSRISIPILISSSIGTAQQSQDTGMFMGDIDRRATNNLSFDFPHFCHILSLKCPL